MITSDMDMYDALCAVLGDTPEADTLGVIHGELEKSYMELYSLAFKLMALLIDVADGRRLDRAAFEALAMQGEEFGLCEVVKAGGDDEQS